MKTYKIFLFTVFAVLGVICFVLGLLMESPYLMAQSCIALFASGIWLGNQITE